MRDDLGDLARSDAVIERQVDMEWHLDRLMACDKGGNRHDAPVPWREARLFPDISERTLRVLLKGRGDCPHIIKRRTRFGCRRGRLAHRPDRQREQRHCRCKKCHCCFLSHLPYCSSLTCSSHSTFLPPAS